MTLRERFWLGAALMAFFALAAIYNVASTPFEAPDEIGHFYYVMEVLRQQRLPVVPATAPAPNYEHEGAQPPLYYVTAALFTRALSAPLGLRFDDLAAPLTINPHSTCGQPAARYNVTFLAHDFHAERFPYAGRVRILHVIRLWSALLATATVAGVFAIARRIFPDRPLVAWMALAVAGLTPEFLFSAASVSNDALVTALATWGVYLALRVLRDGPSWPASVGLGLLSGAAALSKVSGATLGPLAVLAIAGGVWQQSGSLRRLFARPAFLHLVAHCALVTALFGLLTGWWFARNLRLYGDLTGTAPLLALLPLRTEMSLWILARELPGLFQSWWGVFGCTLPPLSFYGGYALFTLMGVAGLLADRRALRSLWRPLALLGAWGALMFAAYVQWNWVIHAPKGRLLYPALAAAAIGLAAGWEVWLRARPRWQIAWGGALALAALTLPLAVMRPRVVAPPLLSAPPAPLTPSGGDFGSTIRLLGYDLAERSLSPGGALDLTLYWQALAAPDRHYTLAIQARSAVPGATDLLFNFNTWPGGGNAPTGFWRAGEVFADRYRLTLPETTPRAQAWVIQVVLYDLASGERLPYVAAEGASGDTAELGWVRVGASDPEAQSPPEWAQRTLRAPRTPVFYGDAIALEGLALAAEAGTLTLDLWWRAAAAPPGDLTLFVHVYDAAGQLLVTGDGPPLAGGFPTGLWQPGDRLHETRTLALPEGAHRLGLGWYDPQTGERLPATASGAALPDATLYVMPGE